MSHVLVIIEWVLVAAGCLVVVASTLSALVLSPVFGQLHALTAVTTVGAPLVGLGAAVGEGWSTAGALILLIVVITGVTGPVLGAATARMAAQREHLIKDEVPE